MRLNLAGVSLLITSVLAGLLLIEVTRKHIVVTEEGLTQFSPWSGAASFKWSEIERVRYSAVNRWFLVEGAGRSVRVARDLVGIGAFADSVKRKLAPERWAGAASVFAVIAGN
jgi:hypothetical protein